MINLSIFKKGMMVENPVFWKKMQVWVAAIGVFLPSLAVFFPWAETLITKGVIAGTLTAIGIVQGLLTVSTTDKIGLY